MKRTLHKALSLLLTAAMVLNMGLTPVFAEGVPLGASGLTECHSVHDSECGYTETVGVGGCTHEHGGDCGYTEGTAAQPCTFKAEEDAEASPADATKHSHDDTCGYAPATEGTLCTHEHNENCGYGETITITPCAHTCEVCKVVDSGKPAEKVCICEPALGASDVGHGEDCPLYAPPELSEAVKALIAMVDALPNAADITEENKEATKPAYEAAAMAYEALSDADKAVFEQTSQYTKLMALRDVLFGIAQMIIDATWDIENQGDLTLTDACGVNCNHEVTGTSTTNKIIVESGTHSITLQNAGLEVNDGNTLTITGGDSDSLNATGSGGGAGIGFGVGAGIEVTIKGGTVTINGGTVTATGGSSGGAGIGGGFGVSGIGGAGIDGAGIGGGAGFGGIGASGNFAAPNNAVVFATSISDQSGKADDTWSGIIFEETQGAVYGNQTLQADLTIEVGNALTVPVGTVLTIPAGKTLTNDGTLENNGTFTNNGMVDGTGIYTGNGTVNLTKSIIKPPKNLSYNGSPKVISVKVLDHTFTENTDYTVAYSPDNINGGEVTPTVTPKSGSKLTGSAITGDPFTISQSGTEFTGGVTVDKADKTYTYGDTITVNVTPKATGVPKTRAVTPPTANQMALFKGNVQLTAPQTVTSGTLLTFTIDTTGKLLSIGSNTITAKYVESASMAGHEESITVTLNKKPLTATVAAGTTKVYDGSTSFKDVALTLGSGEVLSGDTVNATADGKVDDGKVDDANVGTGKAFTATNTRIIGSDAAYYSLDKGAVSGTVAITKASGLTATAPKNISMVKEQERAYTYDLSQVELNHNDTGTKTYTLGTITNTYGIFKVIPGISGSIMSFTSNSIANAAPDQATQVVTISTQNYEDMTVTLTFDITNKMPVIISGIDVSGVVNGTATYSGAAVSNTGTAIFSEAAYDGKDLVYAWYQGASVLSAPPKNVGNYSLKVSIPESNAEFIGELVIPFEIIKRELTIKARNYIIGQSDSEPTYDAEYDGLAAGESVSGVTFTDNATDTNTTGTFTITPAGGIVSGGNANYYIRYANGTLTINPKYTITFNANGGTTATTTLQTDGEGKLTTLPTASKSGSYRFDGWYTAASGGTKITISTVFSADTTVFAHWTYTGGDSGGDSGGNSGGNSGNGGSSSGGTSTSPPTNADAKVPTKVDENGNATVTIKEQDIADAIKKAQNAADKNGITVNIKLESNKAINSFTVTLPKAVQKQLVEAKVRAVIISNGNLSITFDVEALNHIYTSANADVTVTATKIVSTSLSKEAQAATGGRPVYDFKVTGGGKNITAFGTGKISLSIPYPLQKVDGNGKPSATGSFENPGNLVGVYIDANGKLNYLPGSSYNVANKAMLINTTHLSLYGVAYKTNAPTFSDTANHWAKDDIQFVAARGLLTGTTATTFSPNTSMTRGMFVTALGRLAGVDQNSYKTGSFTDVPATAYYAPYANWAVKNNIVTGTSATTFAPDSAITRQEMAVMTANYAKAIGYKLPSVHKEIIFTDSASIGSWAKSAVKEMQMAGILMGKDGNRFDPTGTATRAEGSAMLRRFVELVANSETAEGWVTNDSGNWMYFEKGKAVTGKKNIGGITYEFDQYGVTAILPNDRRYAV